ncbi:uncharacterized protein LOC117225177 [Megalopta genalis]|uniref:uncharacterized protein LOC117225177 n=1 Tax=Megalopta genalis TaxID=115081 RepID=UPI003FD64C89
MDPRTFIFVVIFVGFGIFINIVITNPIAVPEEISSDIIKILLDCKHSNNETYMACYKREKRNLYSHNIDHSCMKPCIEDCRRRTRQVPLVCENNCKHCLKKVTHRQINITDTEIEIPCNHENCTKVKPEQNKPVTVNYTTHIHIHNHLNTSSALPDKPQCPCYFVTWQPCYCRPTYQICQYQTQWPCVPYGGMQQIIEPIRLAPIQMVPVITGGSFLNCVSNICNPAIRN